MEAVAVEAATPKMMTMMSGLTMISDPMVYTFCKYPIKSNWIDLTLKCKWNIIFFLKFRWIIFHLYGRKKIDESESDNGSIILDLERQRGDGEEEQNEESKKVDDDEDRSNPQYIPKRGVFYEHDDRTADDQ